ncbi:hypothetical protein EON65_21010 [archaeon]|nr:MAG: hypothetical protein EON65_21010 [archaeon]
MPNCKMPYASLPIGKFCRKHDVSLACIRLLKADINTTDDLYCAYKEHFYGPHVTQFGRRILHRLRTAVADLDHAFASVCQLRGEKYKSGYLVALAEKEIWSPALIGSHVSQSVAEGPKEITVLYNERVARSIESLDNLIAARRKELSALSCDKPSDPTFHLKVAHTEKENKLSTLDKCAHHSEHGASTLKSLDVLMDSRRKDLSALRPRNPGSCKPLLRATYSYRCSSPSACAFSSSSITRSPSTRAATFSLPPPYALSPQPQIPVSAPSPSGPFSATLTSKPPALPPERKALAPASLAEDSADGMARAWQRAVALLNTWLLRILRNAMSILMPKNPLVCGNASTSVVAQPGRVQTTSPLSPSSPDTGAEEDTPTTVATTIVAAEPLLASPTSDPFAAFTLCTPSCPPTSSAALSTLATLPMPITSPTSVYFPLLATDAAIDHVDTKDNLVIAVDIATIKGKLIKLSN